MKYSLDLYLIGIIVILAVHDESLAAVFKPPEAETEVENEGEDDAVWHPNWDEVTRCQKGERHSRFRECLCGHYASVADDAYVNAKPMEELSSEGIYWKWRGNKKIHYICLPCSSCPDGVVLTGYCRQNHDTSCDPDQKCVDPTHVFDTRIKACRPGDIQRRPENLEVTSELIIAIGSHVTNSVSPHSPEASTAKSRTKERRHEKLVHVLVIVLAFVVLLIILVTICVIVYFRCMGRRYRTFNRVPRNLSQSSLTTHRVSGGVRCLNCLETPV